MKPNTTIDPIYGFPIDPSRRIYCVFLFDAEWSNPNGDPNSGGGPRRDDWGHGYVTPWSIKRICRDYVMETHTDKGNGIYVFPGVDLKDRQAESNNDINLLKSKFWDNRVFGGLFTQVDRAERTSGAIQLEMAKSIQPIECEDVGLTRVAGKIETTKDGEEKLGGNMGNMVLVPYALYRGAIHYDPKAGKRLTTSAADLALFWESLIEGFDSHRATNRAGVNLRRMYCWSFPDAAGKIKPARLASRIAVEVDGDGREFNDYNITVDNSPLPDGVEFFAWEDGERIVFSAAPIQPRAK